MSAEGDLIAGRYRLHQKLGSGAMGVVWRAVDERLHRTVAVKLLVLESGYSDEETEEVRQRTMREGRIAARLQHPNAVAVHDVAEHDGQPVLVMEYLPSQSLASVLTEQGALPPLTVAGIGAQLAAALVAAHEAGIVHRDLKPGNVLLGDDGTAKITDFGISRAVGDVSVTQSGIITGTPAYLAPEAVVGCDPAPASDVFSLGSTLYAAVEGRPPFGIDDNPLRLLHRVVGGRIKPPQQAGPMTDALTRMLQAVPADRPTMAQAQLLLLEAVAEPLAPTSTPATEPATASQEEPGDTEIAGSATETERDDTAAPSSTAASTSSTTSKPVTRAGLSPSPQRSGTARPRQAPGHPKAKRRRSALLWGPAILITVIAGALAANPYGNAPRTLTGSSGRRSRMSRSSRGRKRSVRTWRSPWYSGSRAMARWCRYGCWASSRAKRDGL